MWVSDRSRTIFVPQWLNKSQLDDVIAIVNLDGKDVFFDPGSRYTPFGQLAWQHTGVSGIRQTDGGSAIAQTAIESYKLNRVSRVANLTMSSDGELTGKIDLTYTGAPALHWRQVALRGDDESLRKQLQQRGEEMLPRTLDVEVADIKDLTDYEKPLVVTFKAKGTLGNSVGKRVMLPADLFFANAKATFPHEKREFAVYFEYPQMTQDAVRINLPQTMAIEAIPSTAQFSMSGEGAYALKVTQTPNNFTARRDFIFNDVLVLPKDYANLRQFYAQLESKDQETVVLKAAGPVTASSDSPALPGK